MPKDILVALNPGRTPDPASDYAISLASDFYAHLTGLAFALEPIIPAGVMGGGISGDIIDRAIADSQAKARDALANFDAAAQKQGVRSETRIITAQIADAASRFGKIARHYDVSVMMQPDPDADTATDLFVESALFDSGRPVIVVPYIQKEPVKLDHIVCCWDGSKTAARAIGDAAPLLAQAKSVELLIVKDNGEDGGEEVGADMAAHLARHKLNVTLQRITAADIDVGNAILSYVADRSADFLVMGGYGHSRWREFLLGGATRQILSSMTLPTLMSH
ncbi:universal stress protein [Pseudorhodoplanes sp.]|uniref:universal stress protein n=1 Tax=Pseudorhodoplanes sp. TaxID=1934341 RepID=UPI00391C9B91